MKKPAPVERGPGAGAVGASSAPRSLAAGRQGLADRRRARLVRARAALGAATAAAIAALGKAKRGAVLSLRALAGPRLSPAFAGASAFALAFLLTDPTPSVDVPLSTALYASGGELLGASVASDGQWRLEPRNAPPARYVSALIAFEDKRFLGHAGFDTLAIARAAVSNVRAGRVLSGASTITMQAARLSRPPAPRTIVSKLRELWLAVRLELGHSKRGIAALYSSLAPYGGNVVGLEAASFRWFGGAPERLTWAEAATLAVLPNSPGLVYPGRSREELGRKRDALLEELLGDAAAGELEAAVAEALPKAPKPMPDLVPWLVAAAGPGRVDTTLDKDVQSRVARIAARHAARLSANGIGNLAVVVLRTSDSTVEAYVGNAPGADPARAPWVDCAAAPRSSGSVLKPFLYASMLDSGELSPSRLVPDIPTRVGSYSPENNLKTYAGAVRADAALARSLNVPFVRLLRSYGVERFAATLERMGFTTLTRAHADYGLTLILGGAEITLVDAASAYAAMARIAMGDETPMLGPASWRASGRRSAAKPGRGAADPPFSAGAAWLTIEALVDVARPGEDAPWQEYASSRRIAWKTGTSFGSRDAWAIGATPDRIVAVWAGNADGSGRPEIKGTDTAAPLLFDVFGALAPSAWFARPGASLRFETVCADSGYPAGPDCARTERIEVPAGASAERPCPYCSTIHVSDDGRYRVTAESSASLGMRSERRFSLPPAIEWYYSRSTPGYRPLPPWAPGLSAPGTLELEIMAPENGSSMLVPIELDGSPGKTVFRAAHRDRAATLYWHLDGDYLGQTTLDHRMEARPAPGRHELVIVDQRGNQASCVFNVYPRE